MEKNELFFPQIKDIVEDIFTNLDNPELSEKTFEFEEYTFKALIKNSNNETETLPQRLYVDMFCNGRFVHTISIKGELTCYDLGPGFFLRDVQSVEDYKQKFTSLLDSAIFCHENLFCCLTLAERFEKIKNVLNETDYADCQFNYEIMWTVKTSLIKVTIMTGDSENRELHVMMRYKNGQLKLPTLSELIDKPEDYSRAPGIKYKICKLLNEYENNLNSYPHAKSTH